MKNNVSQGLIHVNPANSGQTSSNWRILSELISSIGTLFTKLETSGAFRVIKVEETTEQNTSEITDLISQLKAIIIDIGNNAASVESILQQIENLSSNTGAVVDTTESLLWMLMSQYRFNGVDQAGQDKYISLFIDKLNTKNIQFDTSFEKPPYSRGLLFYDKENETHAAYGAHADVTQQIGKEIYIDALNTTGATILNGAVVRIDGASSGFPIAALARADDPRSADSVIGFATHDVEYTVPPSTGNFTIIGTVGGLNTSLCAPGDEIYLSPSDYGEWTAVKPVYPNYQIQVGIMLVSDATDGKILVNVVGRIEDIFNNSFNGCFFETIYFSVTSTGGVITGSLERDGGGDLTMNFSTGPSVLDCTPPVTVILSPGTDTNPQINYVYIPIDTKILTASTSYWPSVEHIKVADTLLWSATGTGIRGALVNRNWNDHLAGTNSVGHVLHLSERLRLEMPKWQSGVDGSLSIVTASSPDDLYFSITSGAIFQNHRQLFPAIDMSVGDNAFVINDPITPYKLITNGNQILADSTGSTLANRYFSLVLIAIQNKTGETSHMMINLPKGSYGTEVDALNDANGYTDYSIPISIPVGILVRRFNLKHSPTGSGSWTLNSSEDLRMYTPNVSAGGGGGGTGVNSFTALTDTLSSYIGYANNILAVNPAETGINFIDDSDFALLPGRAGGQTLTGGTLTTENLILEDNTVDANQITLAQIIAKMDDLVDDLSPQLGGTLDAQEHGINNVGDITHNDTTASDWTLKNEDLDKDVNINVNLGGVDTTAIQVDGSTGDVSMCDGEIYVDCVNSRFGVGTITPTKRIEVFENIAGPLAMFVNNPSMDGAARAQMYLTCGTVEVLLAANSTTAAFYGTISGHELGLVTDDKRAMTIDTSQNVGIGVLPLGSRLAVDGAVTVKELSVDPTDPVEGRSVLWMSDGTGLGDDGDVMIKITAGGITKVGTIVDYSAL